MTRKQALADLIAKVEAGTAEFDWTAGYWPRGEPVIYAETANSAYNGSLDAALALHEAVLGPDWSVTIESGAAFWNVEITHYPWDDMERRKDWVFESVFEDTPARAWLLAILKALHAQEGEG